MNTLAEKLELACWIAKSYFDRGMGSGTFGNMSFCHDGKVCITGSGTCFGRLQPEDFSCMDMQGNLISGKKPSKEWPLHLAVYQHDPVCGAVIHIHSTYSVLWSCLEHENANDCIPDYTPYLRMKLGSVSLVDYAQPGSEELMNAFRRKLGASNGWLLRNHGLIAPGKTLMDAFAASEELEESCHIAWELRNQNCRKIR